MSQRLSYSLSLAASLLITLASTQAAAEVPSPDRGAAVEHAPWRVRVAPLASGIVHGVTGLGHFIGCGMVFAKPGGRSGIGGLGGAILYGLGGLHLAVAIPLVIVGAVGERVHSKRGERLTLEPVVGIGQLAIHGSF